MGGWASRVGDFEASQYDYYYDELITESANRVDIESQKVIIDVKHIPTSKTWQYEITELWHFEWLGDHGFIYAF